MPSPKQYADALASPSWVDRALPMKGRATFLPYQDTLPGSVMNKRSLALPGIVAGAINAFTAPGRAYRGSDPTFNSQEEALDFALNMMGGGMGASKIAPAPAGSVGMFVGKKAKTANIKLLKVAEKMQAAGVPDEAIHAKTGWTFGFADGKPRFEIDDNPATIRGAGTVETVAGKQGTNMGDVMWHPSLYDEYPNTKGIPLEFKGKSGGAYGTDMFGNEGIMLGKNVSDKSTPLHELQHSIQRQEGFATGGSPEMFMRGYQNKLKDLNSQVTDINQQMRAVSGTPQYDELMNARSGIVKQIQAIEGRDGLGALEAANKDYRRLAGEAEARLTQSRMNMNPAERAASYPPSMFDVPVKDQIVRYGDNVGGAMMQRPKTEFEILHDTAQRNAALPVEQGGLGLPSGNSYMDRAGAMGAVDYLHGTQRLDRLLSGKNLDPKRATSGPMPFGTDTPPVASSYAMNKQDTSRMASNTGDLAESFQVSPKSLGLRGKNPYTVEQSWHHLSPEVKADILDKSRRIGYENPAQGEGAWVLHPTSQGAPFSPSHFDYELKAAKGNPLAALRSAYGESGMLDAYAPSELADIYKLAGYPHEISQANAPWTSAQGVLTGKAMINNPLKTSNVEEIRSTVIPALKEAFKNDRTRLKTSGSDEWAKDARYTPKDWVNQLEQDLAKGDNSYVWTSIPDKVTDQIKKLGYQGIIDTGGKGGDLYGHQVVIPFQPSQVRSRFAAFDPMRRHEADILAGVGVGGMLDPQAIAEALRGRK